jgi:hypothetical protein
MAIRPYLWYTPPENPEDPHYFLDLSSEIQDLTGFHYDFAAN